MSSQKFKITMNKIQVTKDGDSPGRSELYWSLMVDDQEIAARSVNDPYKAGDGDTIVLGQSGEVTKGSNAALTVLGSVSDKDGFLKGGDDTASFKTVYTSANNFGVGSHTVRLSDGKHLDVSVDYSIARA